MSTSTLRIPADTEQVRVARLVAGSAARRAGVTEDEIEDVRLAVGEAVGRAVVKHRDSAIESPVVVQFIDGDDRFVVVVQDQVPDDGDDAGFAMAVISGLVPSAHFSEQTVEMAWAL
jgi:anti-sigma regulatory factor (Ser/Thr protein kinase)